MSSIRAVAEIAAPIFAHNGWGLRGQGVMGVDEIEKNIQGLIDTMDDPETISASSYRLHVERDVEDGGLTINIQMVIGWVNPDGSVEALDT